MNHTKITLEELGADIELSAFLPDEEADATAPSGTAKTQEWHAMLHVEPRGQGFSQQYDRLRQAEAHLMGLPEMAGAQAVFKRYFLSDATNQQPLMEEDEGCTVSRIQQPPLDGSKVALWLYLQRGTHINPHADNLGSTIVRHNGYEHIWTMGLTASQGDSYQQTATLLGQYEQLLDTYHATLEDHCIRTWFFVRDVDTHYGGLVAARRDNFSLHGLTPQTHYIASTGIGGNPAEPKALVQLGSYALKGLKPGQLQYLYAPTHLNRTSDYGVTFERGTLLRFGDRRHAIISGTASINNQGEVVHTGDIRKQTQRMWENVAALLAEADMDMHDAAQFIVYLRDTADFSTVSQLFRQKFPDIPTVFTLAPVCRPAWLIEMECIAISADNDSRFACL